MDAILERFPGHAQLACFHHAVDEPYFSTPYHFHPEIEILHVAAGHGTLYVGDGFREFAPGSLALIGGGVPHWWASHRDYYAPDSTARCRATYVQIVGERAFPRDRASEEHFELVMLLARARRGMLLPPEAAAGPARWLAELGRRRGLARVAAMYELLGALSEARDFAFVSDTPTETGGLDSKSAGRLGTIYAYVAEHYAEAITLAHVAPLVGLTETSFSRWFKSRTNGGFSRFLTRYRLAQACTRLRETDETVGTVAATVGFRNLSNFNRAFRRHKGLSPRAYRARFATLSPLLAP